MYNSLRCTVLSLLLVSLAGCDKNGAEPAEPSIQVEGEHAKTPAVGKQRVMLNEGYSMLYKDAGSLDLGTLILYMKVESKAVDSVVTAVSDFGGQLQKDLEKIARDYPGVRIDLDPLPELETRKRVAMAKDRARYFAPVVGRGGREYERTVLIAYANGINHERHLCQVMAGAEPDVSLQKFLLDAEKHYDGLYDSITALLDKEYFLDANGKTKG